MYMRTDWNNIKTIKTHVSSSIQSCSYADYVCRIAARIARERVMYRDEYLELCERIAGRFVSPIGIHSTMKSITSRTGYGRIISGKWEVDLWEAPIHPTTEGYYCHIHALTAPFLFGYVCYSCKCELREKQRALAYCETCQKEIDRKAKALGRINRDSREAKEIRSLTRKLERCLREKSTRTPPVPDQHDAAD